MTIVRRLGMLSAAGSLCLLTTAAFAHVTLEAQQSSIGSTYKAVLRVPHGCDGQPTLKLRVQIPEGVIAVKPMPKAGWDVDTVEAPYKQPYDYYGTPMTEGVREIVWTGKLLDKHYDEFVFRAFLTDGLKPDTTLYFPTVQECGGGKAERWIEIPAEGKKVDDYKYPAPGVRLRPKATD
ncbi:YcnI family copper-binding membrane protein [Microvirga sp. 2TAF3]|uniref:YcnI family copper-binding membrane protein n=1 Tax=Microvirga sp. 2TAF3 TaxID=3233014 RepID=UPI003F9C8FFC